MSRDSYKLIVALSTTNRMLEIKASLCRVPLLQDLTEQQLDKICDSIEIFPYNVGDVIINKGSEGNVFYMIKEGVVLVKEMGNAFKEHTLTAGR